MFHQPDRYYGALSTGAGIVGILTFFVVPRVTKRLNPFAALMTSYSLICLGGGIGVGLANTFTQYALSYAVLLGTVGFFNVVIRTERVRRIPREHFAKTIAIIILLNQLSLPAAGSWSPSSPRRSDPRASPWVLSSAPPVPSSYSFRFSHV